MYTSQMKHSRGIRGWIILFLILTGGTITFLTLQSEMDTQTPITQAEELIATGDYYDALFALKPLLMSEEKSTEQEEALWLAHQLAEKVSVEIEDESSVWGLPQRTEDDMRKIREARDNWRKDRNEKAKHINELGHVLCYSEPGDCYYYDALFLQQLLERYPNTSKRPYAEYYLIFDGLSVPRLLDFESISLDATLKALHAYVEKYEKTARIEVYKAYLEIARIHHGTWAALMEPDHPSMPVTLSVDFSAAPEQIEQSKAFHRAEALKYYSLFHINPHGLTENTGYVRLKRNELSDVDFISWGC